MTRQKKTADGTSDRPKAHSASRNVQDGGDRLTTLPPELAISILRMSSAKDGLSLALTCRKMHNQYLGELYRIDAEQCRENGVPWALRWAAWEGAKPAFEASIASLDAIGTNSTDVVLRFFDRDHDDCCEYDFSHYPETYLDRRAEFAVHMEFLDEHDEHGLLNVCCIRGHLELVKLLLAKSANVNGANGRGLTAISYASNEDVARVLVEAGATFELQGDDSPLRYIYLM
ncbi:hypothetical protein SCAR479_03016, partial [Seiridium cardinale]